MSNCNSEEEDIKPNVTQDEIKSVLERYYGLRGGIIKQLEGYDDANYHYLPQFSDNPFIPDIRKQGYVLKVMNSLDSKNSELCEAQNSIMIFLRDNKIPSPIPIQTKSGKYYIKEKFPVEIGDDKNRKEHIVRLLEYQPGITLKNIPKSYPLLYQIGIFVSKLDQVLKKFHHPIYATHNSVWHLRSVPKLFPELHVIENPHRLKLVKTIMEEFTQKVMSKENTFEKSMIHGDFNEHNVLMIQSEDGEWKVSAILDFGDSHISCHLFELAITLCYMMFECKSNNLDPVIGAGHLLSGYLSINPDCEVDFGLLKVCICARICQSLVLGLKAYRLHPENTYVLDSQHMGWPLVEELWDIPEDKIANIWKGIISSYSGKSVCID